jgi:hypothetical protein
MDVKNQEYLSGAGTKTGVNNNNNNILLRFSTNNDLNEELI